MKIAENISWKKLQDKVVAVNLTTGTYYTMNVVASAIWNRIAEGESVDEIVKALEEEFDQDAETIRKDTLEQLDYWKKEKIVVED